MIVAVSRPTTLVAGMDLFARHLVEVWYEGRVHIIRSRRPLLGGGGTDDHGERHRSQSVRREAGRGLYDVGVEFDDSAEIG